MNTLILSLILVVPQDVDAIYIIKFCKDRNSWEWWINCWWMRAEDAIAMGVSAGLAIGAAMLMRWISGGRQ